MGSWELLSIDEKIEAIRGVHPKCAGTAATIAAKLFEVHGHTVSRNAVIGYYHRAADRLKDVPLAGPKPAERKPMVRTSRVAKSKPDAKKIVELAAIMSAPKPQAIEKVPEPKPLMMTLLELGHHDCRYAVDGEKEHMLFCGNATSPDSPYCAYHHKLCHGHGTKSERLVDHLIRKVA